MTDQYEGYEFIPDQEITTDYGKFAVGDSFVIIESNAEFGYFAEDETDDGEFLPADGGTIVGFALFEHSTWGPGRTAIYGKFNGMTDPIEVLPGDILVL